MTEENFVIKHAKPYINYALDYAKDNGFTQYHVLGAALGMAPTAGLVVLVGASILCIGKNHICTKEQYNEISNGYLSTSSLIILWHSIPGKVQDINLIQLGIAEGKNLLCAGLAEIVGNFVAEEALWSS